MLTCYGHREWSSLTDAGQNIWSHYVKHHRKEEEEEAIGRRKTRCKQDSLLCGPISPVVKCFFVEMQ